jgi:hypothetical protein
MYRALGRAGWQLDELDLLEVNEAFAAQSVAVVDELKCDQDRVNVNGGAIAIGPISHTSRPPHQTLHPGTACPGADCGSYYRNQKLHIHDPWPTEPGTPAPRWTAGYTRREGLSWAR